MANPVGRPTSYDETIIPKCLDYLENFNETYGDAVPMVVGLCKVINRSKATIYNWAKDDDKPEFLDILSAIEEMQHVGLVNGGLKNQFNSAITKMMMTKHGYSDSIKQEISNPDGSLTQEINDQDFKDKLEELGINVK